MISFFAPVGFSLSDASFPTRSSRLIRIVCFALTLNPCGRTPDFFFDGTEAFCIRPFSIVCDSSLLVMLGCSLFLEAFFQKRRREKFFRCVHSFFRVLPHSYTQVLSPPSIVAPSFSLDLGNGALHFSVYCARSNAHHGCNGRQVDFPSRPVPLTRKTSAKSDDCAPSGDRRVA